MTNPVAWLQITRYGNKLLSFTEPPKTEFPSYCGKPTPDPKNYPLYTRKEWVGLTVEEIAACCMESTTTQLSFYNAIEAKLREKNSG
jgi:hypothetical protein